MTEAPPLPAPPWSARRALLVDLALVGVGMAGVAVMLVGGYGRLGVVLSAVQIAPLLLRRTRPALSFALVAGAMLLQLPLLGHPIWGQVAMPVAVYSVTAYAAREHARVALVVALAGGLVGPLRWYLAVPWGNGVASLAALVVITELLVIAPWALGALTRTRRAYVEELLDRGHRLEREAAQRAELAASDERARIAREMHDVVAHGLSVMVVQADGARYAAGKDPGSTAAALETIASTGRESLAEMRRMLGLLRSEDGASGTRPQPGLADLDFLLAEASGTGMVLTAEVEQPLPAVGAGVGLTVYRLVQEGLTNVRKHAGPGARTHLVVRRLGSALRVSIEDDGRGATAVDDGQGHGMIGMHERVTALGGRIETGPRPGGGFRVEALVPFTAPVPAPATRREASA